MQKAKKKEKWKQKAAVGAVCAATSAAVLVGGLFDDPADLLMDGTDAITIEAHCDDGAEQGSESKNRRKSSLRHAFQALPLTVRALVGVPLWGVGWCLLSALGLLWQSLLTPLGGKILGWLLTAVLALGVIALTAKAMFPHVPLRKLLSRRMILLITSGVLLCGILDTLLPLIWDKYPSISLVLRLCISAAAVLCAVLSLCKLHSRSPSQKSQSTEQQALTLADSVCQPRYKVY